jgi:hypothetical protein
LSTLQPTHDFDPRLHKKKDWGSAEKNERDFIDWCDLHALELKYQGIVRRDYLHNYYGVKAFDLAIALRRDYLLSANSICLIMKHLLYNNKHVEIDRLDQDDERNFVIYKRPRFKENVQYPYSVLSYRYYDEMAALNTKSDGL